MSLPARWALFALCVVAVVAAAYAYWRHGRLYPSTDDAYVEANVVRVAAQISGPVAAVPVQDQQHVRHGQLLFEIDRRSFELAVAQATARLQAAGEAIDADAAAIAAAQADVRKQQVQFDNARGNARRVGDLRQRGFVSSQAHDDAMAGERSARAELELADARLKQTRMRFGQPGDDNQRRRDAQASLDQARLDLSHTQVTAACDGQIAELSLRPGSSVRAGAALFALVCTDKFWIGANFKETQLERIRPGNAVEVRLDMYPGQRFAGRVEAIGRASGASFSLLPPQNATGNWVKVTQRVPVRVALPPPDPAHPFRVGTSASVTVDTTAEGRDAVAASR